MPEIPNDFVNYKTTKNLTKDNVPKMFSHLHNTREGVFGEISVLTGILKFYGFTDRHGEVEQEITIHAGEVAISPPQYWHKVEFMTEDTQFKVAFYAQKDSKIVQDNLSERQ